MLDAGRWVQCIQHQESRTMTIDKKKHIVAIFGGAVSGAEAAHQLTNKGIECIVFEQNALPYGKIEDGLPKWHQKLRDKEERKIDERLSHPLLTFVPGVRLGRDLDLEDVAHSWGFSAVLLAIGAGRDRSLPIEGIDAFAGKGLVYQNPFIYWYNHKHEPGYNGPRYETHDGAIIVGGGLASLDVAKVLMFENVERALRERGHEVDLFTLDRSIAKVLEELGYTLDDLGIKGCTLYYRRRIKDMPLSPKPPETPDEVSKVHKIQEKIFANYQKKYLFHVAPLHRPVDKIVEDDRLAGLVFQKTKIEDGRVVPLPGTDYEVRAPMVISSIGSLPESIRGIPMAGHIYRLCREDCCRVEGFKNVFAIGNAVTGRGNIRASQQHGKEIAETMARRYLNEATKYVKSFREAEEKVQSDLEHITGRLDHFAPPTDRQVRDIRARVKALQHRAGYDGNYLKWVDTHRPVRLEEL
jgi:ferredoxin--NADP+ reductase